MTYETTTPHRLKHFGADISAGLVVFLVALPLCLGIAMASDAPLFSGILSGIVGGIVVGLISGSHTSVSGPAAGLTTVVAAQLAILGSFEAFLLALVLAGLLQIVLGMVRAGAIADFVPSSVIKGLLAAIGLILILKQIPHLLGHDPDPSGEMSFHQPDKANTFSELLQTLYDLHIGAALIGILSLALLFAWGKSQRLSRSPIPAPLVVVVLGILGGFIFDVFATGTRWQIGDSHLVQVPLADSAGELLKFFQFPDVSHITNPAVFTAAITLALVASLETLLNLEAVDKIDPSRRVSPPNRELIAQGVGNVTAGLIGGIPVTSVIIRSSVNINTGAKTKLSTILHGILLLVSVTFFAVWLNRIPLSALAAILIATGLKLASPKLFRQMWEQGLNMFLPFITTVVMILVTDLLVGVMIGLAVSIAFILRSNQRKPLRRILEKHVGDEVLRIELSNQVSFLSRLTLSNAFNEVPPSSHVMIDARRTDYIDPDVLSLIVEFQDEIAPARGITVSTAGLKKHYEHVEDQIEFVDLSSRELQDRITPDQVLQILKDGNQRFAIGQPLVRDVPRARIITEKEQHPLAIVFAGTSSRTPIEAIFDVGLGDISCVRSTANWTDKSVLGSLEYATEIDGVKLIVVMGHSHNNAFYEAINRRHPHATGSDTNTPHVDQMLGEVHETINIDCINHWGHASLEEKQACVDKASRIHVQHTIQKILEKSQPIRERVQKQHIKIVGCMYNVESGIADFFEVSSDL